MLNTSRSRSRQALLFAQNFIKHPKMIGSFIPSSKYLIDRLLGKVDWQRACVIVEYGPGVGTISREVLQRMRGDAVLIVIEMNEDFVGFLRQSMRDPRLRIVHGSAVDVRQALASQGLEAADYIISGIPYTTLPEHLREQVMRETREALAPGGAFLVYQFTRAVLPYLQDTFDVVTEEFEPLNILPAQLFHCPR
ncbi:MAG TPA: methyltransferase domain-containing protein [Clostridia bacterium]|nr:methyltransferase domain-containing protein [Clostridia bacterium]